MLQARLAGAHSRGVGVDRNRWRGGCSRPTAPARAVGLPAAPPASAPLPALPCPAGSLAGRRCAGGERCVCTHREAHLCVSFSSHCLCFAASTGVFWGRRARSSVPAGWRQACRHRWCSGEPVPGAKRAQSFRSLDTFSGDQQRYEHHFGQLTLSRDDMRDAQSGAVWICSSAGGSSQCRNGLCLRVGWNL